MILLVNGKPVLAPVGGNVKVVVNANWPLFEESGTYYLFNSKGWMTSKIPGRELGCHRDSAGRFFERSPRVRTIPT